MEQPNEATKTRLRRAVRHMYDLQKLRVQVSNRDSDAAELTEEDREFMASQATGLQKLEKESLKEIKGLLKVFPIYAWLEDQRGVGPTMAGVLITEIDITRCETPSALWAYAGLSVNTETGKAVRRQKGQKANWNPFLKTKMVGVLADLFLKLNSPWRKFYDDYRHRKDNQILPVCMACEGSGKVKGESTENDKKANTKTEPKKVKCYNCGGTGGPAPWGHSAKHRQRAAQRYMVKMFLLELWKVWRELEGLPVVAPYSEAKLGIKHGAHSHTAHP